MSSSFLITRTVYKSLIKVARRLDSTVVGNAAAVAGTNVAAELSRFNLPFPIAMNPCNSDNMTFTSVVRGQFLAGKTASMASSPSSSSLLNAALQSLALANQRVSALTNNILPDDKSTPKSTVAVSVVASTTQKQDDSNEDEEEERPSKYTLGQVFRHSRLGYRAVIVGWDPACRASEQWITNTGADKLPNGVHQPFYHCLVDVRDRPSAQISYVAEDLIEAFEPITTAVAGEQKQQAAEADTAAALQRFLVIHPLLTRYFSRFVPSNGQYVVRPEITEAGAGIGSAPVDVVMTSSSSSALSSVSVRHHVIHAQMGGPLSSSSSSSTATAAATTVNSASTGQLSDSDFEVGTTTDEDLDDDDDVDADDDGTSSGPSSGRGTRNSSARKPAASVSN